MTQATPSVPTPPPAPNVISTKFLTVADVNALRARGSALSDQLNSATGRRETIRRSLTSATGADRAGLEQRIGVLDARIAGIETDMAENGKQLASLEAQRAIATAPPSSRGRGPDFSNVRINGTAIGVVLTIFVLSPLAMSISRFLWRQSSRPSAARANPADTQRLERIEHAIDAIAIEVERVSEGQRFVTKVLGEGRQGAPAPLSTPVNERLGTR